MGWTPVIPGILGLMMVRNTVVVLMLLVKRTEGVRMLLVRIMSVERRGLMGGSGDEGTSEAELAMK